MDDFCRIDPNACGASLAGICKIDPDACPHEHALPSAAWSCPVLGFAPVVTDAGVRPIDLGKPDPTGPWEYAERLKRKAASRRY
jgi:hypothetical protein